MKDINGSKSSRNYRGLSVEENISKFSSYFFQRSNTVDVQPKCAKCKEKVDIETQDRPISSGRPVGILKREVVEKRKPFYIYRLSVHIETAYEYSQMKIADDMKVQLPVTMGDNLAKFDS